MVLFEGKRRPHHFLVVYLILAIMGTFVLSMVENLELYEFRADHQTVSAVFLP
jgi:uncharacterized membrane protein YhaH (DUF805 family)